VPVLFGRRDDGENMQLCHYFLDEARVRAFLNGEVMQEGTTQKMIFSVAELVSFLSQGMTLVPGDVILTGTPPGVGSARDPQVWLKAGDEVTIEIEGLGSLTNPVEKD
jgi:2-keto-4-pentenoate hydratase/2-oxohepta-3-ene-1,7-dioic acid hydratase in catechol pathway